MSEGQSNKKWGRETGLGALIDGVSEYGRRDLADASANSCTWNFTSRKTPCANNFGGRFFLKSFGFYLTI